MLGQGSAKISFALAIFAGLIFSPGGYAQIKGEPPDTSPEVSNRADSCTLLKQGQYAELDKKANGLQQDYEVGKMTDLSLLHDFRSFCPDKYKLEEKYGAWIAAYPQSYSARLAYGVYLSDLAYYWKGHEDGETLSPAQAETVKSYADRAMQELTPSIALTSRPVISFYTIMGLSALSADNRTAAQTLDAADKSDPKNFVVRYKYMATTLTTRSGGSLEQMVGFRDDAQKAGVPEQQLRYFDDLIADERAWLAYCQCRTGPL
jgi:hypothetical protein